METKELSQLLVRLRDEDETKQFENLKTILSFYHGSANEKYRDIIYEEYNRLSKKIYGSIESEKQSYFKLWETTNL